jgi:hypothetical protein
MVNGAFNTESSCDKIYFLSQRVAINPAAPTIARIGVGHSGESLHPLCARAIPVVKKNIAAMRQRRNFMIPFLSFDGADPANEQRLTPGFLRHGSKLYLVA